MPRTDEQREADELLTAAIENAARAYFGDSGEMVMEYVVVLAQTGVSDEGDTNHSFSTLFRDNDLSSTRALGLLEMSASTLRNPKRVDE